MTSLGFKLTRKELAQAVPIAGTAINGGLNAQMAHRTFERSQRAYRLRFLTEKYDLDLGEWVPDVVDAEVGGLLLVDELVEEPLSLASGADGADNPTENDRIGHFRRLATCTCTGLVKHRRRRRLRAQPRGGEAGFAPADERMWPRIMAAAADLRMTASPVNSC